MIKVGKYEFNDQAQATSKIDALGDNRHTFFLLGHIEIVKGEWDEDGNVIVEPVYSDKFHVDVLWQDIETNPYGWATYEIDLDNDGVHSFFGVNYLENKI